MQIIGIDYHQNKSWSFQNLCCPIVLGSGSGKRF